MCQAAPSWIHACTACQSPLSLEIIWKDDYFAKFFVWLCCACFCNRQARGNQLIKPVMADTKQTFYVHSPWIMCDHQSHCKQEADVLPVVYCTRTAHNFAQEHKMGEEWDTAVIAEWKTDVGVRNINNGSKFAFAFLGFPALQLSYSSERVLNSVLFTFIHL